MTLMIIELRLEHRDILERSAGPDEAMIVITQHLWGEVEDPRHILNGVELHDFDRARLRLIVKDHHIPHIL